MIKDLYFINFFYSQIWLNLPRMISTVFYIFLWRIATLAANKNFLEKITAPVCRHLLNFSPCVKMRFTWHVRVSSQGGFDFIQSGKFPHQSNAHFTLGVNANIQLKSGIPINAKVEISLMGLC